MCVKECEISVFAVRVCEDSCDESVYDIVFDESVRQVCVIIVCNDSV